MVARSPGEVVRRTVLSALAAVDADADTHRRLVNKVTRTIGLLVEDVGLAVPLATHILLAH